MAMAGRSSSPARQASARRAWRQSWQRSPTPKGRWSATCRVPDRPVTLETRQRPDPCRRSSSFDDIDAVSSGASNRSSSAANLAAAAPTLVVVIHREEAATALLTVIDQLAAIRPPAMLGPLEPDGVRAIVALYAGSASGRRPLRQLMDNSGGVPAAIHRAAATWARNAATERLGDATERTEPAGATCGPPRTSSSATSRTSRASATERAASIPMDLGPRGHPGLIICPYKGLASFDEVDADYYFGRDRLIAELVARLVGNGFLGFVGASGSGKSSALRAGLLPALAGGVLPGSDRWMPGDDAAGRASSGRTRAGARAGVPDDPAAGSRPPIRSATP